MADVLTSVAQLNGMKFYAQGGPAPAKNGFVYGMMNGFVAVVGHEKRHIFLAVVGQNLTNKEDLKLALAAGSALKKLSGQQKIMAADDGFIIRLTCFIWPKAAPIQAALDEVTRTAAAFISPYKGQCQKCGRRSTDQLVLLGTMPKIVCDTCLSKLPEQKLLAEQQFRDLRPRTARGLFYLAGLVSALVLGYGALIAWIGMDGRYSTQLDFFIGLFFALMARLAFEKGAGKMTRVGMIAAGFAGVAGKLICSTSFFVALIMHDMHLPLTLALVKTVASGLPELSSEMFGGTPLFFVAVGLPLVFLVSPISRKKFPELEFVRLSNVELAQAATVGA